MNPDPISTKGEKLQYSQFPRRKIGYSLLCVSLSSFQRPTSNKIELFISHFLMVSTC